MGVWEYLFWVGNGVRASTRWGTKKKMIGASYPIGTVGPDSIVELSESMF